MGRLSHALSRLPVRLLAFNVLLVALPVAGVDIKEILSKNGKLAATDALVEQINRRKEKAFKIWIDRI